MNYAFVRNLLQMFVRVISKRAFWMIACVWMTDDVERGTAVQTAVVTFSPTLTVRFCLLIYLCKQRTHTPAAEKKPVTIF